MSALPRRTTVVIFLAFAFAYFISALVRAITATLSPTLTQEFALQARDLGLLAGGYFLGFSLTQLPLGNWLDRHGPQKVVLAFLTVAVAGCAAFALAGNFYELLAARVLCGVGVSACLMAPLTGYRRWFAPDVLLRTNSWMLMTGSMGMVASTLPVQWLMPLLGWRPLFWGLAVMLVISMGLIAWKVPAWVSSEPGATGGSYAQVWAHPYFRRLMPLGFFNYGGLLAVQTLWAGPWMIKVNGYTPLQAATGLFWINLTMLCTFWTWGWVNPWLARRGWGADALMARGIPLSFFVIAIILIAGDALRSGAVAAFALFCMGSSFVSLAQPAVGMAFPAALAGRALSAYNLVIFAGVFVVQWGLGLLIDGFRALGWPETAAFRAAFGVFLTCCVASYAFFVFSKPHNPQS